MNTAFRVSCLVWVVILMQACSDRRESPEAEIRAFIKSAVEAAENRDVNDINDLVHANYLDQKGYNRRRLGGLLRAYFFRYKELYLLTKIEKIDLHAENEAMVRLYVAMAGSVISDFDALASLRAQIYQFELRLVKEDGWLLHHASWRPASIIDLK
jgi:hypothetical protein